MSRKILLTPFPQAHFHPTADQTIIVPNNHVARQLQIPGVNLDDVARSILLSQGFSLASGMVWQRALSDAILQDPDWPNFDADASARAILHSVNLLFRAGADLNRITQFGDRRLQRLSRVSEAARRTAEQSMLVPASNALARATNIPVTRTPLFLYGYPRLSHLEFEFVDHITAEGSVLILPYLASAAIFDDNFSSAEKLSLSGWSIEIVREEKDTSQYHIGRDLLQAFTTESAAPETVTAESYPDAESEVRALLGSIKKCLNDQVFEPRDVVIVIRNEKMYGPILQEVAWEYEIPIETHYALPLQETRLGAWIVLMLDAVEESSFPFEATAWFLHHALSHRLITEKFEADGWNEARRIHARGEEWSDSGVDLREISWPQTATRLQWTELLLETLNRLNVVYLVRERAQDVDARLALIDALPDIASPAEEILDRGAFVSQLRDLLALTEIGANEVAGGIAVHTPLALFGTSYPHVFVPGMIDEVLPGAIRDDPHLDFAARRELAEYGIAHLECAAEAARREQLSFAMLLLTPERSLHLSTPRQVNGAPSVSSPYLDILKLNAKPLPDVSGTPYCYDLRSGAHISTPEVAASALEALPFDLLDPTVDGEPLLLSAREAHDVLCRRESGVRDTFSGMTGIPYDISARPISPSELTVFGQCTYRWQAARLLGLNEPDESNDDLVGRDKGQLFHNALALAANTSLNVMYPREAILDRLEGALDAAIAANPLVTRISGWAARRAELLSILANAVNEKEFLQPGARIVALEADFWGLWNDLRIRGRIDRIDSIDDLSIVIDYKTSGRTEKVKDELGNLTIDLQIPIYVQMGHLAQPSTSVISGGYYLALSDGKATVTGEVPGKSRSAKIDGDSLKRLSDSIRQSTEAGDYPVDPDNEMKACEYCVFDSLCRRGSYLVRLRRRTT